MSSLASLVAGSVVRVGSQNRDAVLAIQAAVGVPTDGRFGTVTKLAVEQFQTKHDLMSDGVVGHITATAMDAVVAAPQSSIVQITSAVGVEPVWNRLARTQIGIHEVGDNSGPNVARYIAGAHAGALGDPWCFTGDTEIMTAKGWDRLDALANDAIVYQADADGVLSLTTAKMVRKEYDGDVFDIQHESIRLTCDVGHRWFGQWTKKGGDEFRTLESINTFGLHIPTARSGAVGLEITDRDLTLLAAYISDGSLHRGKIQIDVSRERKVTALAALNPAHIYHQKKAYGPITKVPMVQFSFTIPSEFPNLFTAYKVLSSAFINSLTAVQAQTFLRAYSMFDGNGWGSRVQLYTASQAIRDTLISIATLAGFHVSVCEREQTGLCNGKSWMVGFCPSKQRRMIKPEHIRRRRFTGSLYCVSVPEGRIVVRGNNGVPVITGNCAIFANWALESCGIRGTRSASSQSFRTDPNFVKLDGPAFGALVVFWRAPRAQGVGHVGFYQKENTTHVFTLGGNEGDMVKEEWLPKAASSFGLEGYYWPKAADLPKTGPVTVSVATPLVTVKVT